MKKNKLRLNAQTIRQLTGYDLGRAAGGLPSAGAACPQTAFPPCATVAGGCTQAPQNCTVWTQNTCNAPCTNGSCACGQVSLFC